MLAGMKCVLFIYFLVIFTLQRNITESRNLPWHATFLSGPKNKEAVASSSCLNVVTALQWSRVWALVTALLSNNLGQVVHTHVSPSSIIWYWPMGADAVQLGR